jgi:hypothetical protein
MQTYEGWKFRSTFFDVSTSWRWVVSFTPPPLYPRGESPCTNSTGDCVGPRVGLDYVEKWKFLTLSGLELRPLAHSASNQSLYHGSFSSGYTVYLVTTLFSTLNEVHSFRIMPLPGQTNEQFVSCTFLRCARRIRASVLRSSWDSPESKGEVPVLEYHAMKRHGGAGIAPPFLILTLDCSAILDLDTR